MNNKINQINFTTYTRPNGHNEFNEFYHSLPLPDQKVLKTTIEKIRRYGIIQSSKIDLISNIDKNLYEIRSIRDHNIQRVFYFHYINRQYIITHGFTKKTQKHQLVKLTMLKNYVMNL